MCDASMIKEYGLLGAIDSLVNMVGERTAIILSRKTKTNQMIQSTEEEEEVDDIEGITYAEIQYYSQILAVQLYFRYGIRKDDRVLIACEGSTAAEIITIIACMRLGAVFVPIDTKAIKQDEISPQAKINTNKLANIIEDCRPKIAVITGKNDEDAVVRCLESLGLFRYTLLKSDGSLNDPDASITSDNLSNLPVLEAENLEELYILYTSGSTGRSKGVLGTYRGLTNRLTWQLETFPYDFGESALRRTPLTFVDSLVEIFAPLLASVPICSYLMDSINDFGLLSVLDELALEQITRLTLIPSQLLLACRLNQNLSSTLPAIKYCFVSGEECPITLVEQFALSLPTSKLVNLYGSTEVAGDVTGIILYNPETSITLDTKDNMVPLGHPIPGNNLFVVKVNENKSGPLLSLLPSGEVGELLVIGEHVAKGYFGYQPPNLRFIPNPFLQNNLQLLENYIIEDIDELFSYSNAILMGDLVSYNQEKDCYYYHGRVDRQVKIRGNRVELDDIERQLLLLWENYSPRNDEFMVVQVKFNQENSSKEFLVLVIQESLMTRLEVETIQSLKSILQEKLSELYLPDLILVTSISFPKTSSHKIDRMGLIKRIETFLTSKDSTSSDFVSFQSSEPLTSNETLVSTNEIVMLILSIFQQVLPKLPNDASIESLNFLSLGGNSLNAVEVLWLLRKSFPLKQLAFDDLTLSISELAHKLSSPDPSVASVVQSQDKKPKDIPSKPSKPTHKRSFDQALSSPSKISWSSKAYSRGQHHQFELNQYQNWNFQRENLTLQPLPWAASWSYKLLKCADASPLICQGIVDSEHSPISYVYMTSYGGDVCCLDAISGHIIWINELERHVESSISVDLTLKNIFLGTYLKNLDHNEDEQPKFGLIHALDMESGDEVWNFPTFGECKATPTIDLTRHIVYGSCFQGGVYKLEGKTGELLSQIQVNGPVYAASSLTHEGNFLHVVTTRGEYSLIATEPELTILWQYTFDQTHCFASPTPLPWDDNKILLSANDGSITCLQVIFDPENEENQLICEFLWQMYCSDSPIISSPCCYQSKDPFCDDEMEQQLTDYCFVGSHDGVLRRILLATGEMDWELPVQSVIFTSPIVFTYQKRSYVIVGCTSGVLMLIDILTKEIIQSIELPAEMYSSPVIFGNRVYVGCRDDRLYCFSI